MIVDREGHTEPTLLILEQLMMARRWRAPSFQGDLDSGGRLPDDRGHSDSIAPLLPCNGRSLDSLFRHSVAKGLQN